MGHAVASGTRQVAQVIASDVEIPSTNAEVYPLSKGFLYHTLGIHPLGIDPI